MSKHTPGPWRVGDTGYIYAGDKVICDSHCAHGRYETTIAERDANTAVIEAAPNLLEACKAFVAAWDADIFTFAAGAAESAERVAPGVDALHAARVAIAKAEGGQG